MSAKERSRAPVGYVRCSTLRPGTLAEQVRAIFALVSRGLSVRALAIDFSNGRAVNRAGLRCLIEAAKRGLVSEVVVSDPSRLARSHIELEHLLGQFDALGVRVTFGAQVTR